ncbi:two-component sensor histidine kinase [Phenylobacterium hankyongense]|uniref:histidine kinase n=1 Tax=Phenylobacterium hankyongense TaxID=1813876 RepID=A0A328AW79_9CAUL|nr:ATP-binding protein [Phenylobacterium hankyongense]RAK58505.1 two-component sensor histidine kinase [Phenylobacterium hankyongense]
MTLGGGWPRTRAPIGLQLVALLLACLLAAQIISFGVIVFTPPPRPSFYHAADVAAALRGGPLKMRLGRPLVREVVPALSGELSVEHPLHERSSRALAQVLGVPESQVRLRQHDPDPELRLLHHVRRLERSPFERADFDRRGDDVGRAGFRGAGPPGWRRFGPDSGPEMPIVGAFAAALQQPDGRWVVVRSTPEPFPTAWQLRTSLCLLAGFLIVAPAGYLFARRITAPLKRFAQAAETLGRDPHAPQITLRGPAEIGAAAHAFNEMQARLKRYIGDRTALVGAISHDLRTPLARIKFKIEAAPPRLRDSVLTDVNQMEQMIGGVLAFIRDEGQPRQRERLDLLSLVECVVDDAALLGADVEIVHAQPVTVDGDPVALQRLFNNLVDNAVKYGGWARIQVRRDAESAVVVIADRGPGLSGEELGRVFQPFYRTDASRNLDNAGVGLGLPIARSAARAHGGDVELTSGPDGTTAVVTLPAAA